MANVTETNVKKIDTDSSAVALGALKVKTISFSVTAGAGSCTINDEGGNLICFLAVDGTTKFVETITFGEGIIMDCNIPATSGVVGTGATILIYCA